MTDRPLRILHLTAGSDAGGLSRYIFDLCSAMHQQGHQVAVAGEKGAWHWLFDNAPFPWIEVPLKGSYFQLHTAARILRKYLAEHPVDIIHTHYRRATLVARRLQQAHRPPILYTVHLSHIGLNWPWRWFTDFGDHTHVASNQARSWLIEDAKVPPEQITLIPHGVDPNQFPITDDRTRAAARSVLGLNPENLVAAYVGRLDYPKNVHELLNLAQLSRETLPNLRILLAGEGPQEVELHGYILNHKLSDRIFLLGHRDPLPIYQAADALLLPSSREGFSLVCAEAMSTGIPVFRTNTSGTEELIIPNTTGQSTPIDDFGFSRKAIGFLSDRDALTRMGTGAAQHIRKHFTFDRQLQQTLDLYYKLTGMI